MTLPQIHPARRMKATVGGLFTAARGSFETSPVDELRLGFDGVAGDYHAGATRRTGGREPWYPRGTEIRNERQVTILNREELAEAAAEMGIARIEPEWIGANMTLDGLPMLSMLPAGTLLFFEGGVTLKVDFQNRPCKLSGRSIARHSGREDDVNLALSFVPAAKRRRGIVAWVEKPGSIRIGATVEARVPEQWIYPSG